MGNLSQITYLGVREAFNYSDTAANQFVLSVLNKEIKARLMDEAKEYYAQKLNFDKEDIYLGNINKENCPNPFLAKCVIGNVNVVGLSVDMEKLTFVSGDLTSNKIYYFPNLETVLGAANFNNSGKIYIPKLKYCTRLSAVKCWIPELNTKIIPGNLSLVGSAVLDFNVETVGGDVNLAHSQIEDISSLTSCGNLNVN